MAQHDEGDFLTLLCREAAEARKKLQDARRFFDMQTEVGTHVIAQLMLMAAVATQAATGEGVGLRQDGKEDRVSKRMHQGDRGGRESVSPANSWPSGEQLSPASLACHSVSV